MRRQVRENVCAASSSRCLQLLGNKCITTTTAKERRLSIWYGFDNFWEPQCSRKTGELTAGWHTITMKTVWCPDGDAVCATEIRELFYLHRYSSTVQLFEDLGLAIVAFLAASRLRKRSVDPRDGKEPPLRTKNHPGCVMLLFSSPIVSLTVSAASSNVANGHTHGWRKLVYKIRNPPAANRSFTISPH